MKTILQINPTLQRSTGSIAQAIGELVINEGWDSWIAYSARNKYNISKSNLVPIGSKFDSQIHAIQTRLLDNHGFCSTSATKHLVEKLEEIKPSIVHIHNAHGYYLNVEVLFDYLRKEQIPVVWTFHDCWPMTGHCPHFEAIGCTKWKTGCFSCPLKKDYPGSLLLDSSRSNWKRKKTCFTSLDNLTIVPVSNWLESVVRESYLQKYPTQVIYNGIDLNIFYPKVDNDIRVRFNIGDRTIVLGVATGWYEGGGLRRYNEFMGLSSILDDNYRIILIGLEQQQIKELPQNVIGLQRTANQNELVAYYSSAAVFVNPTYQDSLPTVNMEALACGTPVITYRTGGSPEILDKYTGWAVEKGDVNAIAFYVQKVHSQSAEEKEKQRKACRERAMLFFNKRDCFRDYIDLYKKILQP